MPLIKPIIIIGAARSGTTVLAKALAQHPDIAYLEEPNVIWRYRNARLHSDYFPAHLATDNVSNYINEKFNKYLLQSAKQRLLEKTPSNSLRLSFVRRVFPNSKIIHLLRDGREVSLSASRKWISEFDKNKQLPDENVPFRQFKKQLIKLKLIPPHDFPYYIGDITKILLYQLGLSRRKIWGPRFPGITDFIKVHTIPEVCALQWQACVELSLRDKNEIRNEDYLEIKYEELCSSPQEHLLKIIGFSELPIPENYYEMASMIRPPEKPSWDRGFTQDDKDRIEKLIYPTLIQLGYIA